jgi:hypothetical protein
MIAQGIEGKWCTPMDNKGHLSQSNKRWANELMCPLGVSKSKLVQYLISSASLAPVHGSLFLLPFNPQRCDWSTWCCMTTGAPASPESIILHQHLRCVLGPHQHVLLSSGDVLCHISCDDGWMGDVYSQARQVSPDFSVVFHIDKSLQCHGVWSSAGASCRNWHWRH